MNLPKISVVIPVYNVEKYLTRCLDSIVNQTYKNIEIIIVNDCTPDNSQMIIDLYATKDNRIKIVKHKQNKGLGGARNTGIDNATGDYISFIDSDDWVELSMYEELISEMNEFDSNVDIIKFGRFQEYQSHQTKLTPKLSKKYYSDGWKSLKEAIRLNKGRVAAWDNLYKLSFIRQYSLYFKEKLLYEDAYFTVRAQILAKSILICDKYFYHYVKGVEGTITNTIKLRDSEVLITISLLQEFLVQIKREDILKSDEYNLLIFRWVTQHVIYRYQETRGNDQIKDQVIQKILKDKNFKYHMNSILKSDLSIKYKVPAWMLQKSYLGFKLLMSSWFKLKNIRRLFSNA